MGGVPTLHLLLPRLSSASCLENFKVNVKSKETTLPWLGGTFISRTLALSTLISHSLWVFFSDRKCRHHKTLGSSITINFPSDPYCLAGDTIRLWWVSMGITFMILPKLQFCPQAPQLQEILRGRDCLRSEECSVMDETIKMTLLVKLKVYVLCLWLMSGWWHLDPVSYYGAAWDPPCGRMAAPMAGKSKEVNLACLVKEHLHKELSARIEGSSHQK